MSLLRKRSWWQKLLHSRLALAAILTLCVFVSFAVYDRYVIEREVAERRAEKEAELQVLGERKDILEDKVKYLRGDQGQEAEIRRHFDVAKEGETVVVLTGEKDASALENSAFEASSDVGIWSKLFSWWPF